MAVLAQALAYDGRIELAVATNVQESRSGSVMVNGVRYYAVPQRGGNVDHGRLPRRLIESYHSVINEVRPQVLHIHGTESFHGLLTGRGHLRVPTVISIQGILDVYVRYYLAGVPWQTIVFKRTLRDWIRRDGLLEQQHQWSHRAKCEREIFQKNTAFIGRTLWDRCICGV